MGKRVLHKNTRTAIKDIRFFKHIFNHILTKNLVNRNHSKGFVSRDHLLNILKDDILALAKPIKSENTCSSKKILMKYNVDLTEVHIVKCDNVPIYLVNEPDISNDILNTIVEALLEYITTNNSNPIYSSIDGKGNILDSIFYTIKHANLDLNDHDTLIYYYYLRKILSGYGPLYILVNDDYIEDISVEGNLVPLAVYHKLFSNYKWINTNIVLDNETITRIALILSYKLGRPLSISNPIVEGLSPEGHRICLTLGKEVTSRGTTIVIRRKPTYMLSITDLIINNTLSVLETAYIMYILENQYPIMIVGGVAAGKTTLLQALLTLIPDNSKIITIEDVPELQLPHTHWDPLVSRTLVYKYSLEEYVDELELLTRVALRRRGDYLVIGETRGREAKLLVQAVSLGYGTLTTFHASDLETTLTRLMAPPISISDPKRTLKLLIVLRRMYIPQRGYVRRVHEIWELNDKKENKLFQWNRIGDIHEPDNIHELVKRSILLSELVRTYNKSFEEIIKELTMRYEFIKELVEANIKSPVEILKRVTNFYYRLYENYT